MVKVFRGYTLRYDSSSSTLGFLEEGPKSKPQEYLEVADLRVTYERGPRPIVQSTPS